MRDATGTHLTQFEGMSAWKNAPRAARLSVWSDASTVWSASPRTAEGSQSDSSPRASTRPSCLPSLPRNVPGWIATSAKWPVPLPSRGHAIDLELCISGTFLEYRLPAPRLQRSRSAPAVASHVVENEGTSAGHLDLAQSPLEAGSLNPRAEPWEPTPWIRGVRWDCKNDGVQGSTVTSRRKAPTVDMSRAVDILSTRRGDGNVWRLACKDRASSLAVQGALELAVQRVHDESPVVQNAMYDLQSLLFDFQGRVLEAAVHRSANFVLQLALEIVPAPLSEFIASEILNHAVPLARSHIGCRIVLRVFRHQLAAGGVAATLLADEILAQAPQLCCHEFGKYVMQELLECGAPPHQRQIVAALRGSGRALLWNATSNHASRVVETAIKCACPEDVDAMIGDLLRSKSGRCLVRNRFGRHVARSIATILHESDHRKCSLENLLFTTRALW